jgi:hypothetical protein
VTLWTTLLIATLLVSCSAQNGAGLPSGVAAQRTANKASAYSGDLIYAAAGKTVYLFTYPSGQYVTQFVPPYARNVTGLCSDAGGNVFIGVNRGFGTIYEYAHGATSPSATLSLGSDTYALEGCAAEAKEPILAVAAADLRFNPPAPGVLIYTIPSSTPNLFYSNTTLKGIYSVTFMNDKNIFAWCPEATFPLALLTVNKHGAWPARSIKASLSLQRYGRFIQWDKTRLAVLS